VVEAETNVVAVAVEGAVAVGSEPIEAVEASTSDAVLPLLSMAFPSVAEIVEEDTIVCPAFAWPM
jgi:hypothetical protein